MSSTAPPSEATNIFVECSNSKRKAQVSWEAGSENYAPILSYSVQYNTTFAPDTWVNYNESVPQNMRSIEADLSAWTNYTFRVLARNKFGLSEPSRHSIVMCTTEDDVPDKNPENVIGEGDQPNNLVIFWTPMPGIEQNGPTFSYIITWRRADIADAELHTARIDRPDAWHYVVPARQETYKPFNITVKAKNVKGEAKVPPQSVVGHSGEDVPLVKPDDVGVHDGSITATTAEITWTPVDTSPEMIRGFFRGYRVQYGKKADWPLNVREQDFIVNQPKQYPRARIKRDVRSAVNYVLTNLPANTDVTLHVRVLTKYYVGPPSNVLEFATKEGEPGPPAMFDVHARGPTHFELRWEKPHETNGKLIGYNISYQAITGLNLGRIQYRAPVTDPEQLRVKLTGLEPSTYYRVFLSGVTKKGKGEDIFLDMKTTEPGTPQPPTFTITHLNDTWVEVSWEPSHSGNPGSIFYVQYRPRGYYHYMHTPDEVVANKIDLFGLDPGTTYQIRVVSKNGDGQEAPTSWQELTTDGVAPGRTKLSTSAWFYGIWLSLFLIILFIVAFFFLKRVRDKWWKTKEEEIEEQIRQLQAEEAAMQLGIFNQYAKTGSRELINDPNRSGISDYKQHNNEDGDYSDDEFDPEPAKQYPQQQQATAVPPMSLKVGDPPSPDAVSAPRSAGYAPAYSLQPQSAGYPSQSPTYPSQGAEYAAQPPVSRYANVPRSSQEDLSGRFVTGSSHQLAPGQSVELRPDASGAADTFV
ncbi:Neuroglian [Lamellibrachia satsuma]|nr:Neuroglian [Lamellibrachia satsuma]